MINEQATVESLLEKKAQVEADFRKADEEYKKIADGYKMRLNAYDLIIADFRINSAGANGTSQHIDRENTTTAQETVGRLFTETVQETESQKSGTEEQADSNGNGAITKGRNGSLRGTAKENFKELPPIYTKHDVRALIESKYPELEGRINKSTLRGIADGLVEAGLSRIKQKGFGITPQVYEKVGV